MNAEQSALGESKDLQQLLVRLTRQGIDARLQVEYVFAHGQRNEMRQRRVMFADNDFLTAPTARKRRGQFAADALMQIKEESLDERMPIEFALADLVLSLLDSARQVRREFGVA